MITKTLIFWTLLLVGCQAGRKLINFENWQHKYHDQLELRIQKCTIDWETDELIAFLNFNRFLFCSENFLECNALVYDNALEEKAVEMALDICDQAAKEIGFDPASDYRVWYSKQRMISLDTDALINRTLSEGDNLGDLELLFPTREQFGCATSSCQTHICLISPGNTWTFSDLKFTNVTPKSADNTNRIAWVLIITSLAVCRWI
ncbi:unnamed protein product [Caenorhabditis sp. 36 PRJEB53466]|nr:unnamed protein product [Caenorhabditis sp. 36 PRJEB53466]